MARITGNTADLKPRQLHRLKNLSERRIRENAVVSQEFARSMCELSHELARQIGALIDRQGHVRNILVGDAGRVFIPELPRERSARLRGLRLVHTHLRREPLSEEDLADLTLLRLDYITAVTMTENGLPALFYSAHITPGKKPGYLLQAPAYAGQLPQDFSETIAELEASFHREETQLKLASPLPRALLVGVYTPDMRRKRSPEDSIAELRELCRTAGIEPVGEVIQRRPAIDATTVIGSGKVKEISIQAVQDRVEILLFDQELSPAQATRLSRLCDLKILDRTQLILDIFSRNARSRDGKLQVELAQLRYLKGRLSETDDNMSRLTGGIGARGPGETKLEIGRRRVEDKIARLERELKSLKKRREINRKSRQRTGIPVVSIVGYTNAGKSTLLNSLTFSEVVAEDRLFATLDPTTRRLRFPEEKEIILSDTVGFIHELPPELSRAFEATLEELGDSSLLLHCVDASDPRRLEKMEAVLEILGRLDLLDIPRITIFNKCDRLTEEDRAILSEREDGVLVSAQTRWNLAELLLRIEEALFAESLLRKIAP
jgi:GTP-binding protein HflX